MNVFEAASGSRRTTAPRCSAAIASTRSDSARSSRASLRAACEEVSIPCSDATAIASLVAGSPSRAIVPTEETSGADGPNRSVNIRRRMPSAKGDRHRLPEHTTRIDATASG